MDYIFKASVTIEMLPVSADETTEQRIQREQAQARLDALADGVARRLEAMLDPINYEEAIMGLVLLRAGQEKPDQEMLRRFYEARDAVTKSLRFEMPNPRQPL